VKPEALLTKRVSVYLLQNYPEVVFKFDLASDQRLTIGQAKRNSQLLGKWSKGHPDLVMYEPRKGYCGLFLELKATKNGKVPNTDHTRTQRVFHQILRNKGYWCDFCVNYDNCIEKIVAYMKLKRMKIKR
jgi:hypothetical protein